MEEDLISKKELLEQYQISYGALYRWKRMGLIPEAWFLRRSAPTGQETYFRRAQICPRIEQILREKERVSLEQLAAELAGQTAGAGRMLILETKYGKKEYPLEQLLHVYLKDAQQTADVLEHLKEVSL